MSKSRYPTEARKLAAQFGATGGRLAARRMSAAQRRERARLAGIASGAARRLRLKQQEKQ